MQRGKIDPKTVEELRGLLAAAIPPQHREHVGLLGRLIAGAAEVPAQEGNGAALPPRPAFERVLGALRAELDRQGIAPSARQRIARVPLVPVRPWRVNVDDDER